MDDTDGVMNTMESWPRRALDQRHKIFGKKYSFSILHGHIKAQTQIVIYWSRTPSKKHSWQPCLSLESLSIYLLCHRQGIRKMTWNKRGPIAGLVDDALFTYVSQGCVVPLSESQRGSSLALLGLITLICLLNIGGMIGWSDTCHMTTLLPFLVELTKHSKTFHFE